MQDFLKQNVRDFEFGDFPNFSKTGTVSGDPGELDRRLCLLNQSLGGCICV